MSYFSFGADYEGPSEPSYYELEQRLADGIRHGTLSPELQAEWERSVARGREVERLNGIREADARAEEIRVQAGHAARVDRCVESVLTAIAAARPMWTEDRLRPIVATHCRGDYTPEEQIELTEALLIQYIPVEPPAPVQRRAAVTSPTTVGRGRWRHVSADGW